MSPTIFNPSIIIGRAANCFFIYLPEKEIENNKALGKAMGEAMKAAMKEQNKDELLEELKNKAPEMMEKIIKANPRLVLFQTWDQVLLFIQDIEMPELDLSDFQMPFIPGLDGYPGQAGYSTEVNF